MNLGRILNLAAAVAAVAAAVVVCIVAASYGVYAVAETWLSPAGAAAVVAGAFALVAIIVAWLATRKVTPRTPRGVKAADASPVEHIITMARQRPLVALGVGAAAAFVLLRNPAVITAVVSAFMAGTASKPRK